MKTASIIALCMLSLVFMTNTSCKSKVDTSKEITIKLDFFCEHGKTIIEEAIAKEDGVTSVIADVKSQAVTIKYDSTKENKDKLVAAFEKIGFKTEFSKPETEVKKSCTDSMGTDKKSCPQSTSSVQSSEQKTYQCPMKCEGDKTYTKPGKCPKCSMDLELKKTS
jgi:Cu2+-exporting ATPase